MNEKPIGIPLKKVGLEFQHRPCVSAVRYWRRVGLLNCRGERIKLKFFLDAGRLYTTKEQINIFKEAVSEGR